ncbi:MAG: molybdenum cofactor biosynthesis protein MoaE [Candidatus Binatia bacterium]|nr:molybdenum cofactor biosynthesis protein MoaE [Candidatus Binatia bacterium]
MFRLTNKTINIQELVDHVNHPKAGAIATFVGTTRDHNEGRKVTLLEYEAYAEMAEKELARLGEQATKQWKIERMAIVHRLGAVHIGEASVIIAVSAAHRQDAFEACRFAIEELKKSVPIWKKEYFEGGEVWIESRSDHLQ